MRTEEEIEKDYNIRTAQRKALIAALQLNVDVNFVILLDTLRNTACSADAIASDNEEMAIHFPEHAVTLCEQRDAAKDWAYALRDAASTVAEALMLPLSISKIAHTDGGALR